MNGFMPERKGKSLGIEIDIQEKNREGMIYRKLGRTGLTVSAIALGCEGFTGKSAAEVREDFDFAEQNGINFLDLYASNPDLRSCIGEALAGRREKFVIQGHLCSVWENGQYLRTREVEKSMAGFTDLLARLKTEYVDVGMIHYIDREEDFHRVFEGPIIGLAQRLKEEGKIRYLGMSSHNPTVARLAAETGKIDVLMFSINPCYDLQPAHEEVEALWAEENYARALHNIDPERERLYEFCEREGIAIDVMKAFGGGDLLSEENSPFGKALTTIQCIEYCLTRPGVAAVMAGSKNRREMQAAIDWCTATEAEKDYASALSGMQQFTWQGHCMYCGHCAPCSVGIDIAGVNKFYNLAQAQGTIPETVREHYNLLPHPASECIGCGRCEKNCPFGVAIIDSMRKAAARFGR